MPQKMIQSIYHFHSKEGNIMNKIYKVIWSKAKHTYVVASEIAKGHTKGETTGKGLKKLAAAMLVAAALLSPSFAWAEDGTVTVEPAAAGSTTAVEVYTKKEAEKEISALSTQIGNNATNINTNTTNINGLTTRVTALETADKNSVTEVTGSDAKLTIKKGDGSTSEVTIDNVNHATSADSATTAESATKATQDGNGNEISTTYATKEENQATANNSITGITGSDAKLTITKGDGSTSEVTIDNVNHATSADSATTAESATKATPDGNGNEISTTYATKTELSSEVSTLKNADSALDSRTSALEAKTGSLNRVAVANSTSINESMTLKGKQYSATLQVNGSGAQIGVVNNSEAKLANDGGTAYTEYRAMTGAILSKATNDISSTSSNGQVVDTAGDTTGEYSQVATAKSTGTTFTYSNDGGKTSSSTTIKGDSVSTGTVSATAGIIDGTTTTGTSVKASQTVGQNLNALDERITSVKEYVLSETVSKTDAAVQDGAIVKAANTIGDNVTKLDAALAKETAARIGADKAQDKVIQQVNQNMVEGFNTINKNMFDGFTALNQADAALDDKITAETASRVAADTKLVKAMNSGLSLSEDNVLQKDTTTIDAQGNVTPSKTDANEIILKGKNNQITLNDKGIKVGTNSSVVDENGVYTGGDTYAEAKAAMSADGSIKGANGDFTVDGSTGNVSTKGSLTTASGTIGNVSMSADGTVTGVKDLTASGKVTAGSFTDGTATMSNGSLNGVNQINATGNIVTTGNMKAHDITAEGTIKGETINGTTGTFGSLATTSNASVGGTLTANGINNTGNVITDTLTVNHNATVGGDLGVTGDITGKSLNVGTGDIKGGQITGTGLDVGAGTIKTTGAVETGTLTTTGNADIGGDLTVKGKLNVDEIDLTKNGIVGDNNVIASTKVAAGEITSYKKATSTKDRSEKESAIDYDENGTSTWAKSTDADGNWNKSTLTVEGDDVTFKVVDSNGNKNESKQTASASNSSITGTVDGKNYKSYITQNLKKILQGIQNGTNATTVDQTETGIKSTATDGKNTASTNLSNEGFNTYATDGTNKTYTKQTATDIKNTAENGTISNSAKDLVNNASDNMTNTVGKNLETTVGGEMKTTVTGKVTEDFKSDLTTTIGGNKSEAVAGTSEETVTGKKTETYGGLETTVNGTKSETVTGDVTEDYKANLSTTVGGNQTTTVTGDSSLTAENINNEAKNKITNKALDVETDASSSIVNKVSNDAGSNTSTQLSYETKEEMSQADGKTASYLRGAAEEKSQLTDGDKKTTIDTKAGQTNTNITDGTNTSNSLQKADQVASSVTDGTNTTVVNQDAKSLASSITDGKKVNNTSSTVDKSEQLIKASDTQYYAETKTAGSAVEALKSDGNTIIIAKDAATGTVSSAVTDGTNTTGSTMTAKGITNSAAESIVNEIGDGSKVKSEMTAKGITNTAKDGTITNDAKYLVNNASENMTNTVGKDLTTTVGGEMKTTVTGKTTENYNGGLETTVTGEEKHTVNGNQTNGITGDQVNTIGGKQTTTVTGDSSLSAKNISNTATEKLSNSAAEIENTASKSINNSVGDKVSSSMTTNKITESVKDGTKSNTFTKTVDKDINIVTDGTNTSTESQLAGSVNTSLKNGTQSLNNKMTLANEDGKAEDVTKITDTASGGFSSSSQKADSITNTVKDGNGSNVATDKALSSESKLTSGSSVIDVIKSLDDAANPAITSSVTDGTNTSEVKQTASEVSTSAKDISNTATEKITSQIGDGSAVKSEMTAESITNITGNNTVTSDTNGTTFENKAHSTAIEEGTVTKTTISGNTMETGKATMDYAEVMKDLGVHGKATIDGDTSVGGKLSVTGTSTLTGDVTMKSNATVEKDLTVKGTTTTDKLVVSNGATVSGGTTTDTLHVTSTSRFDGAATFKDIVTMEKDLNVGGNAKVAGDVTAKSFKVGENTYIDENGINANNQVIRNVGEGNISEGSHDAVSGGQLYDTNTRVSGLETRMGTVETKVDKLDNKIDKVGANAAAMANLHPLEFDEDSKWNIAAAVGSSGSETASAVGVFYRPNENVMVNASAAMGTGENMFGGGVSLRLGHGGNKAKEAQMKAAAKENRELRAKVDDLTARMDALLSVLNPNMSKDFPDVPENHWAYEAVSRLAGNGIVEGYEDGKYHGERQMTRYEMAEIIYNALSKGAKAEKKLVEEFRPELQAMAAQKKA